MKDYREELERAWQDRRFKWGMTQKEVHKLLKTLKIERREFWKKFGVNTCMVDKKTKEILHYFVDVKIALTCCVEHREKTVGEWD